MAKKKRKSAAPSPADAFIDFARDTCLTRNVLLEQIIKFMQAGDAGPLVRALHDQAVTAFLLKSEIEAIRHFCFGDKPPASRLN